MKTLKTYLLGMAVLLTGLASCSKKDDNTPKPPDTKTLLTANVWSIIKSSVDNNKNGKIDDGEITPVPDNAPIYLTFFADGTGTQIITGSTVKLAWTMIDQQTILVKLDIDTYLRITALTSNEFNADVYFSDNKTLNSAIQCIPRQ